MKHKLFAGAALALAVFIGYLAHAGFPTIVPLVAPTAPSAYARLTDCETNVAVVERSPDLPDLRGSPPRESVGAGGVWLLDPRPLMGPSGR